MVARGQEWGMERDREWVFKPRKSHREPFCGGGTVLYLGCSGSYMNLYTK